MPDGLLQATPNDDGSRLFDEIHDAVGPLRCGAVRTNT
jgi:hypothetical protein